MFVSSLPTLCLQVSTDGIIIHLLYTGDIIIHQWAICRPQTSFCACFLSSSPLQVSTDGIIIHLLCTNDIIIHLHFMLAWMTALNSHPVPSKLPLVFMPVCCPHPSLDSKSKILNVLKLLTLSNLESCDDFIPKLIPAYFLLISNLILFYLILGFCLCSGERFSQCSAGCTGTCYVDWPAWSLQRSSCLCLRNMGIKGMCPMPDSIPACF